MDHRITQCPRCGTSFRVTEAHLAVAAGAVRCGSCLHIFNARDHWAQEAPEAAPEPAASESEPDLDDLVIDDDALFDDNTPLFADQPAPTRQPSAHQPDEPLAEHSPAPDDRLFNEIDFGGTDDFERSEPRARGADFSLIEDAAEELDDDFSDLDSWETETSRRFGRVQDLDEELSASDEEWTRDLLRDDDPIDEPADDAAREPLYATDRPLPPLEDFGLVAAESPSGRREPTFGEDFAVDAIDADPAHTHELPRAEADAAIDALSFSGGEDPSGTAQSREHDDDLLFEDDVFGERDVFEDDPLADDPLLGDPQPLGNPDPVDDLQPLDAPRAFNGERERSPETVEGAARDGWLRDDEPFVDDEPPRWEPAPVQAMNARWSEPAPAPADLNPEFVEAPSAHREPGSEPVGETPAERFAATHPEDTVVTDATYASAGPISAYARPAPDRDPPGRSSSEPAAHAQATSDPDAHPLASLDRLAAEPLQIQRFRHEPRWPRVLWGLALIAMLLLLAGQYIYKNFDALARGEARPWLAQACALVGCHLPPQTDARLIRSGNLIVRSHPTRQGALVVDAIITNLAGFAQPYPQLQLQFSDLNDAPVAGRRFQPSEYLAGELSGASLMPIQQPVHIALELVDPGPQAVNYALTVVPAETNSQH